MSAVSRLQLIWLGAFKARGKAVAAPLIAMRPSE